MSFRKVSKKNLKNAIFTLLLFCLSITTALILGEVLLRSFWSVKSAAAYLGGITVRDKMLGYRFVPNSSKKVIGKMNDYKTTIRINSHGFRGREHPIENKSNKKRILLIGDSDIFGMGVDEQDMLDAVMEKLLNTNSDISYEVINLAMPGIGTLAEEQIFKLYGIKYKPDIVIFLVSATNDLIDNVRYITNVRHLTNHKRVKPRSKTKRFQLPNIRGTHLYFFAKWQLRPFLLRLPLLRKLLSIFYKPSTEDLPAIIDQWYTEKWIKTGLPHMKTAFERINTLCKEHNIEMIITVIPSWPQFNKNYEELMKAITPDTILEGYHKDPQKPQRIIKEFCKSKSIHYIELLDDFKYLSQNQNIPLKHPHDGHLNAQGTLETAKILVRELGQDSDY